MLNMLLWINLAVNFAIAVTLTVGYYSKAMPPKFSKWTYVGALVAPCCSVITSLAALIW